MRPGTGGLLFPYYVGIMLSLRDELKILKPETPVAGASAGSLVAATAKSGISEGELIQATLKLARDCRDNGTRFRLKSVLKKTLEDLLPEGVDMWCGLSRCASPAFQTLILSCTYSSGTLIRLKQRHNSVDLAHKMISYLLNMSLDPLIPLYLMQDSHLFFH
jgi:hypothetical protein